MCLRNISKDRSPDDTKKTELKGYVYDFSADYDAIAVSDVLDIYKYLMKKKWYNIKCLSLWSKYLFQQWCFFGCNLSSVNPLECVSMNNQECKVRPEIVSVNSK